MKTGQLVSTIPYGNQNPWREKHKRNVISRYAQFTLNYNKHLVIIALPRWQVMSVLIMRILIL